MYPIYDYQRFLEDYGIPYNPTNSREFITLQCPYCEDKKKHGGIHATKNYYNCQKCGIHPFHDLIYTLTGMEWKRISRQYKLNPDQRDIIHDRMNRNRIHADTIQFPIGTGELKSEHRRYLINRGFDPDYLINKYKISATGPLGIIKDKNLFAYRIIIPIYYKHRIVSIQARDWTGKAPNRYMTYPEDLEIVHHKDILYGLDDVPSKHIIVVEGVFDKWKLGDHAAALFGTGYTDAQVNVLAEFEKVSIWLDPEPSAQEKAEELCRKLQGLMVDAEIILYKEGDPGSIPIDEAKDMVKEIIGEE